MATPDSPKMIRAELAVLNDPLTRAERPHLIAFIEALQAASSPADYHALHRDLLIRYWARQRVREEELAEQRSEAAERLSCLLGRDPKAIDEIRTAQDLLKRIAHADRVQATLASHLRAIADGLVWKANGYDRAALMVLGRGTRVDRLADDGVGLQAELSALGTIWDAEQAFTVHNDLTTALRHGDLTTFHAEEGRVEIREIKAGRQPGPDSPQGARLTAATQMINQGRATDPETGETVTLHRLPVQYRTALGCLAGAIREAKSTGYAGREIGTMQYLTVIDYRVWAGNEAELERRHSEATAALGWGPEQKTFTWMSALRRIRDRRHSFAGLAPLSLFPAPAEDLADLMTGSVEMHTLLRCDLLEEAFADRGITAAIRFPDGDTHFLDAARGRIRVQVPPQVREQLMLELMTPSTLVDMVSGMLDLLEATPGLHLASLAVSCDESGTWR
ncbi:MAG: hypothetical protein JWO02_223 [Solirubrobacterales bacterium]|nr:hypothetical protein [Solirubrobacterales bacterium]